MIPESRGDGIDSNRVWDILAYLLDSTPDTNGVVTLLGVFSFARS
jgi:hypothetical protein